MYLFDKLVIQGKLFNKICKLHFGLNADTKFHLASREQMFGKLIFYVLR